MKQLNERTIIVGPVRLSYMNAFRPRLNDQKNPPVKEYGATLLIPKEPHKHLEDPRAESKGVADAIKNVLTEKFGTNFKGVWNSALKDGDKELRKSDGEPKHPGYWYLTVSAKEEYPPLLIDALKRPVVDGWNSGDWGLVKVRLYAYDTSGNKGVGAGLSAIQFLHKDEPFGSGGGASDEGFDAVATTAAPSGDEYDPFADE